MRLTEETKPLFAKVLFELMPPLMRRSLLDDVEFCQKYEFIADAAVVFGDSDVSFQRSTLFEAIRHVLATKAENKVIDSSGKEWGVCSEEKESGLPKLVIYAEGRRHYLPDFSVFSPDQTVRLKSLETAATEVNLPEGTLQGWRSVLSNRTLEDDELDKFHNDLHQTPVYVARSLREEMKTGKSSVSSLVPASRKYFERLIGSYNGSESIKDYAQEVGRAFLAPLWINPSSDSLMSSLLLSAHSVLSDEVPVEKLSRDDLVGSYERIVKNGDVISVLGAIEVGLRILPERPEISPYIVRLVKKIRDDNVDDPSSAFRFFSALFVLVDGELSRTRLFSAEPPFYRRLASLSHASLIQRQIISVGITDPTFCEWAFNSRAEQFFMQSFADMRLEPRWYPSLSGAEQIKADFCGRIMIAAQSHEKYIQGGEIHDLILGASPDSIASQCEFPLPYLPGPLEGAENTPNVIPEEISTLIQEQLHSGKVNPTSFIALVNSAMLFKVETYHAVSAAEILKSCNYRLSSVEDKHQLLSIMNGLALAAASCRNHLLADELRVLLRRYLNDSQYGITPEDVLGICLIASASRKDLNEWRLFLGEWVTELSFRDLNGGLGEVLLSRLQCLCHAAPELWATSSKADAALRSVKN